MGADLPLRTLISLHAGLGMAFAARTLAAADYPVSLHVVPLGAKAFRGWRKRIRALGEIAPASFGDYTKLSVVDSSETPRQADAMIKGLVFDEDP